MVIDTGKMRAITFYPGFFKVSYRSISWCVPCKLPWCVPCKLPRM